MSFFRLLSLPNFDAAITCKGCVKNRKYVGPFINIVQGEWCYKNGGKNWESAGTQSGFKNNKTKNLPLQVPPCYESM